MKPIKKRVLNTWNKRIYIQDKELNLSKFTPGTKFNAYYVPKLKKIYLVPSSKGSRVVSKRKLCNGNQKSVIDIKSLEAMSKLQEYETLKINIFKDKIVIQGYGDDYTTFYTVNENLLKGNKDKNDILKVISICSGAGLMDLGFKQEGFDIVYAIEINKQAYLTYKHNLGNHIIHGSVLDIEVENLPDADVLIGGPPCQPFSQENKTKQLHLYQDENAILQKFAEIADKKNSLSSFVLENVPEILTKGKLLFDEFKESLSDKYHITTQILDAKYHGTPQTRRRAIIIGFKPYEINIKDDLSITKFKTVREAFKCLHDGIPNQLDRVSSREETLNIIRQIGENESYKDYASRNGIKNRFSDAYKRLSYDSHCHSLAKVSKTLTLHPTENRVISVRENARLFDVPDDFEFICGKSYSYQMIANGVTVNMAKSIAKTIKEKIYQHKMLCY